MKPIERLSGSDRVTVPSHLLSPRGGDHYVLRVVGDSMIEESICDGDYVIVLRRDVAENGEMCVVQVGDDATIKRYYVDGESEHIVRLQPANPAMQSILVSKSDVAVHGIVVGLMRKF